MESHEVEKHPWPLIKYRGGDRRDGKQGVTCHSCRQELTIDYHFNMYNGENYHELDGEDA